MGTEMTENGIESALSRENFDRREEQWLHVPYEEELKLLECVKNGDVEKVKIRFSDIFPIHEGHLSRDPHRQAIYAFVASVTLVTRFAIEGGLDIESAYSLSDAYIKSADGAKNTDEVFALFPKMTIDFSEKVRQAKRRSKPLPPVIRRCMEYIDSNLHYKITLNDLGRETGKNPSYLCVQFKNDVGISVTEYINRAKINAAKQLLRDDDIPVSEIAATLNFCSQSYFAKVFKQYTGETPKDYRVRHFRTHSHHAENGGGCR
ncbi:MAG: AraC family transcriptional regulator [Clostridiales Family XIII bacterium]|jgi:YesN/AraC family two-component response regulator|nr:AraC family transcriptional regulator [Clostridiales Family XIII bacterium]